MKLKHLFLASLVVCAFASCSDDSSTGIDIPDENYQMIDANLSLTATALDGIKTKADATPENGSNNEQFIHELTAYLFYVDNGGNEDNYKFAAMRTVSAAGKKSVTTVEDIVVKVKATKAGELSDTQLKAVFFANTKLENTPEKLGDLTSALLPDGKPVAFSAVSAGTAYVPMFSQIITIGGGENKLLAGTDYDNWVKASTTPTIEYTRNVAEGQGHTIVTNNNGEWTESSATYDPTNIPDTDRIPITRHVARVQLEGLDCNFTQNYAGATFTLTDVYVANVSTKSMFYGSSSRDYSLEVAGTDPSAVFVHGCPYTRDDYFLVEGGTDIQFAKTYQAIIDLDMTKNDHSGNMTSGGVIDYNGSAWKKFKDATISTSTYTDEMAQFYVYEYDGEAHEMTKDKDGDNPSGNIRTMLILKGKWTNNGVTKGDRYYRIPISDGTHYGIQRNTIYKVYATITGEGSPDPDTSELNACVSFSVKVEPWIVINQYEEDVN